jgi:predicted RNA-binding Zn ribbon-like protein
MLNEWVLPDEPVPVRLMTTIWADADGIHDDLRSTGDVGAWLDAVGVEGTGARATADELTMARGLRDAVRRLAAHVTGDTRATAASPMTGLEEAIALVNAVAAREPAPTLVLGNAHLERAVQPGTSPVTAGLASVARNSIDILAGDGAGMLRACHAPGCVLYFIKAHPRREWCSIACGNRVRAARYYQRTRRR